MNLWKKAAVLLTAALALGIGTVEASESPELEPIAAHAEIWRDEYFNEALIQGGCFAVTDLDGNGRPELIFVRAPYDDAAAARAKENPKLDFLADMPENWDVRMYEAAADGKGLEWIHFDYSDAVTPPDLRNFRKAIVEEASGSRFYYVTTLNRVGETGYRVSYQVISLLGGQLTVATIATEEGGYAFYQEQNTAEAVPDRAWGRYGRPINPYDCDTEVRDYMAGGAPLETKVEWVPINNIPAVSKDMNDIVSALNISWQHFSVKQTAFNVPVSYK